MVRDFKISKSIMLTLKFVGNPFAVNVEYLQHHLQMEVLELQCDSNYQHLFSTINDALTFYKQLDMTKYKNLRQHAVRITSFFGSTYICEQVFSKMKINKSSLRSFLTDGHLEEIKQIVCSSQVICSKSMTWVRLLRLA